MEVPQKSRLYRRISDAGITAVLTVGERNRVRSGTLGALPGSRRLIMAPTWSSLTKVRWTTGADLELSLKGTLCLTYPVMLQ